MASALPNPTDCCQTCCESTTAEVGSNGLFVGPFDTHADLRAFSLMVNRMYAVVLGGVVINDGYGGRYYYDSSSLLDDNDASVIKPNSINSAAAGRWIQNL